MTSLGNLPHVYPGLIWDGVTEYASVRKFTGATDDTGLLRMYGDGTRRFSEQNPNGNPW